MSESKILTEEQVEANKAEYLTLIASIHREGSNIAKLVEWLKKSDFFTAPASTRYHHSYKGGLCEHSLQVYYNMMSFVHNYMVDVDDNLIDTIKILALCHDFHKTNLFKEVYKNEKRYGENGTKRDEGGKFDWVAVKSYAYKDPEECFMYGNHEVTSEYMIRQFFPLTLNESIAILHHHACANEDCAKDNIGYFLGTNPYLLWLHMADMKSCYYDK